MSVEPRRASISAGEIAYIDAGEGPGVLLLHGFPTSSFLWRREIPLLAARMRVIAPDLIGYGQSDQPPEAELSVTGQARHVGELLAHLGLDRVAAVGHGFGGGVAQRLALDGAASALVLIDSIAFDAWPSGATRDLQAVPPAAGEEAAEAEAIVSSWLARAVSKRQLGPAETAAYLEPWRRDPGALRRALAGLDGLGLAGTETALAALDLPALVLWGEEDPFLPAALAERLGEALDGSMVALLPGCGHLVGEDAPETVGSLLYQFLRSRYLGEGHGHPAGGPVPVFLERPPDHVLRSLDPDD